MFHHKTEKKELSLKQAKEGIIKIREVDEIENRKTIDKINETKSWYFERPKENKKQRTNEQIFS